MPTYDYVCESCGHAFEEFQSITAKPLRKCPQCTKTKLKRLIGTGAGIIFKGSGFYETDYRSDNYRKSEKAEKDAAKPKTEGKADKKSDSKSTTSSDSGTKSETSPKTAAAKETGSDS